MTSLDVYNNIAKLEVAYIRPECIEQYDKIDTNNSSSWIESVGDAFKTIFDSTLNLIKDLNPFKDFKTIALMGMAAVVIIFIIFISRRSKNGCNNT